MAYMLMKNSDQGKYGSLMTSLTTQFSMGTSQYPKDVLAAVDILTNHKFDKRETKNNNNSQKKKNQNDDDTASMITTQSSFNQEENTMLLLWQEGALCKQMSREREKTQGRMGSEEGNDACAVRVGKGV
jgi:hypothetical protein